MDILVYKKDGLVVDHGAITEEKNDMWKIEKGGETHIRDGEFEKYTVDSLPEYYEDYKYYYKGYFELNIPYYNNETEKRMVELEKTVSSTALTTEYMACLQEINSKTVQEVKKYDLCVM